MTNYSHQRDAGDDLALVKMFLEHCKSNNIELTIDIMNNFKGPDNDSIAQWRDDYWAEFLNDKWEHKLRILKDAGNANIRGFDEVKLKDITRKYMDKPIKLEECSVSSIAMNHVIAEKTRYKCEICETEFPPIKNTMLSTRQPKLKCSCSGEQILVEVLDKADLVDAQWIRVQETRRDTNNTKIPVTIPVLMKGEKMLWTVNFNDKINPIGFLHYRTVKTKDGVKEYRPWFEAFGFDKMSDMDEEITYDDTFREYIKLEMVKPGYWNKVVKSFCPWIYGQEVMKEVVLLGIGSMKTDMPLRILIIGDPSTGKSDVLKAGNALPAQKHYAIMKNSRGTGMTVTSVKDPDTDQWTVEGGEFVWANNWTLIIDEFQAGKQDDIDGLNSVIWDHEIPYNLAGGVRGKFPAKCALIIACNPQTGRMAKEENIHELLKFVGEKTLPAFISRMSFILFLEENDEKDFQKQVAGHIYDNQSDEVRKRRFWEDWYSETLIVEDSTAVMRVLDIPPKRYKIPDVTSENRFGIKTLQKIVRYITQEVTLGEMPPELKESFVQYYVKKRMDVTNRVNKLITPRYMVHCLGIAQNMGRWHGRAQPNEDDMKYAFELMLHHMTLVATDPTTGELDSDMVNGNIPERKQKEIELEQLSERGKDYQWSWACKKAMTLHEDEYFTKDELLHFLEMIPRGGWQYKGDDINKRIDGGITKGSVKTKSGGRYSWKPLESMF